MNAIYPFKLCSIDEGITVSVTCRTGEYFELFEKHGYYGNRPCWSGHVRQILEKENTNLLKYLVFNSESDFFLITFRNVKIFNEAMKLLAPIFQDYEILEKYIISANRDEVDN
jgi:hypothetical protein